EETVPGLCAANFDRGSAACLRLVAASPVPRNKTQVSVMQRTLANGKAKVKNDVISIFPAAPSQLQESAQFHDRFIYAMDVSSDGRWFAASMREKVVHIWQIADASHIGSVKLRGLPSKIAFSPDGSQLAIDVGTTVYIHRTDTLELESAWKVKYSNFPRLAWCPDCSCLARVNWSATVRRYDVHVKRELSPLTVRKFLASAVQFAPDGLTFVVGTVGGSVIAWDMQ
ncbi:MAG TPA: WD40 repeat domain-containing protein, partial [Gemmataceae bacterium]|nr:WD40 repeat domain-containing protein [Gemmataceae bacterium]